MEDFWSQKEVQQPPPLGGFPMFGLPPFWAEKLDGNTRDHLKLSAPFSDHHLCPFYVCSHTFSMKLEITAKALNPKTNQRIDHRLISNTNITTTNQPPKKPSFPKPSPHVPAYRPCAWSPALRPPRRAPHGRPAAPTGWSHPAAARSPAAGCPRASSTWASKWRRELQRPGGGVTSRGCFCCSLCV